MSTKKRSIDKIITDCFEQIVYSINQPTGARNFQSVFWNISYYDKYYSKSLFENFPDFKRKNAKLACLGVKTIKAAEEAGLHVDYQPTAELRSGPAIIEAYAKTL